MAAKTILAGVCEYKKGGEYYMINADDINIQQGWNSRKTFKGIEELAESIRANGIIEPLIVKKMSDNTLSLRSGERRLKAAKKLVSEGVEILVPVIVKSSKVNDADLLIGDINSNGGEPLLPTEEAEAFKRLVAYGFEYQDIAERVGKSVTHIKNRLELAEASPEVKAAVDAKQITIGQAQEIAKTSDGNNEKQGEKLKKAKTAPKKKQLILSFKKGALRQSGIKEKTCNPLKEIFESSDIIDAIKSAGFDPSTLRITIKPNGELGKQCQKPLWEQEPDGNGQYCCPECGVKVDKADLCPKCYEEAKAEHIKNAIEERASLS